MGVRSNAAHPSMPLPFALPGQISLRKFIQNFCHPLPLTALQGKFPRRRSFIFLDGLSCQALAGDAHPRRPWSEISLRGTCYSVSHL